MSENTLVIVGRLTHDPELRYTPSGEAVANFTVVDQPRFFDRQNNEWKDRGEPLFQRCTAWRDLAVNISESLGKGDEVIVTGSLVSRSYETREGEKRTVVELEVKNIGASLRFAQASLTRTRGGSSNQQSPSNSTGSGSAANSRGSAPSAQVSDEPPF